MDTSRHNILGLIGLAMVAYLGVLVFQIVQHNYELSRQIDKLQDQITHLQTDNQQLGYEVQYYKTGSFQEKEARSKFGLSAPGESVIVLPKQVAHASDDGAAKPAKPRQSNFLQWWHFLFG
jgi:cell division protein FtsL